MTALYTLILRECTDASKAHVAQFLGKAFSLKDATCQTIAGSAPIALLSDLSVQEAAVMQVVMGGLSREGVTVQYSNEANDDLPKIDWPRRPAVFKREIADYVLDFSMPLPCSDCSAIHPLVDTLVKRLTQAWGDQDSGKAYVPTEAPRPGTGATDRAVVPPPSSKHFTGTSLPEITPFSTPALPPATPGTSGSRSALRSPMAERPATSEPAAAGGDDTVSRLNELFPEEEGGGFIPTHNDITSILNRLLPDEESSSSGVAASVSPGSGRISSAVSVNGFSVFLAKINDEARRQKAVPLIAEMAKITAEEAEALSKKVIIPVLKGVSKDDAESARQRFAKIGILARVKGGAETQG
jgi:hypothetical protein